MFMSFRQIMHVMAASAVASVLCLSLQAQPPRKVTTEEEIKALMLKHLAISRDFTLKVADQMPEADYGFKLTPPQMSFAVQLIHISQTFEEYVSPLSDEKLVLGRPASINKADIIEYVKKGFDATIERITKMPPDRLSKTYQLGGHDVTGMELLMELFDHTTHHRASIEMYLRAKGITPALYEF
jgi:uncharacterized damage-inducible protein DinB